jgi:hypothetical protein
MMILKLAKNPIFIVGCPRSGTTLLQLLIDANSQIAIPPESHIFIRLLRDLPKYGDLNNRRNLKRFVREVLNDHRIKDWGMNITVDDFCSRLDEVSYRRIISLLFELYAENQGKCRWGDKTPQHLLFMREIHALFPDAKFIHLIRDGRDVAVSSLKVFVGPASIYGIAKAWRLYITKYEEFKSCIPADNRYEIFYENLVTHPQDEISKVLKLIGEPVKFSGMELPETGLRKHYLSRDQHMQSLNGKISPKKVGIYKRKLTQRQIAIFETIAGDALSLHNYPMNTNADYKLRTNEKLYFMFEDHIKRYTRKYIRPSNTRAVSRLFKFELQPIIRRLRLSLMSHANKVFLNGTKKH